MKKLALLIMVAASIIGCTKIIDVDLKNAASQLVIEGIVNNSSPAQVNILKTVQFSSSNVFPAVSGALSPSSSILTVPDFSFSSTVAIPLSCTYLARAASREASGLGLDLGDAEVVAVGAGDLLLAVGDALADAVGVALAETLPPLLQLVSKTLTAKKQLRIQRNMFNP